MTHAPIEADPRRATAQTPENVPPQSNASPAARGALAAVVALGLVCRAAQYLACRSFWHDEAALLLNVFNKGYAQLPGRLEFGQASPPAFLWAERWLYVHFGRGEYVLRSLPLASSAAALVIFAVLAWRMLRPWPAVFAAALLALADKLIWHAAEVKQYSSDVLCAVVLLFLAVGWRRVKSPATRFAVLCAAAAALVWASHPAVMVFGGVSLTMLPRLALRTRDAADAPAPSRRPDVRGLAVWLAGNALVAASFAALYLCSLRPQRDPGLVDFWRSRFAPVARPASIPWWLIASTYSIADHLYQSEGAWMLLLAVLGAVGWWRRRRAWVALCLWPFALALAAAGLGHLPYTGDRVTLYLQPGLAMLAAAGLETALDRFSTPIEKVLVVPLLAAAGLETALARFSTLITKVLVVALLAAPLVLRGVGEGGYRLVVPRGRSEIAPAVAYLRAPPAGEALYVFAEGEDKNHPDIYDGMGLELFCYWPDPPPPVHNTIDDVAHIPERRFWVTFAFLPRHQLTYMRGLLDRCATFAVQRDEFVDPRGGAAFLFERKDAGAPN